MTIVRLEELVKDSLPVLIGDAGAGVLHQKRRLIAVAERSEAHRTAFRGELHSVAQKVIEDLLDLPLVSSVTVPWPLGTRLASPDYWIPQPAKGSGPPVLRRRWAPAPTGSSAPAGDHWTATRSNGGSAPILERRWASIIPRPQRGGETRTTVSETVTHNGTASAPPTVTRLCLGCGMPLEGKRPQAKAHGPACRQRAYRRRRLAAIQAQGQRDLALGSLRPQPWDLSSPLAD